MDGASASGSLLFRSLCGLEEWLCFSCEQGNVIMSFGILELKVWPDGLVFLPRATRTLVSQDATAKGLFVAVAKWASRMTLLRTRLSTWQHCNKLKGPCGCIEATQPIRFESQRLRQDVSTHALK